MVAMVPQDMDYYNMFFDYYYFLAVFGHWTEECEYEEVQYNFIIMY